jgi:NDP-sugar pyrophosphorylase family protein
MVLAAGLGTRLRPLTDNRPKALVEVAGKTLLEITLTRLKSFGVSEVIINVYHFADMIVDYLAKNNNFGMRIEVSREDLLLDTGGGLKKAAWFFLKDSPGKRGQELSGKGGQDSRGKRDQDLSEPFILHNVDVISNVDLRRMLEFHAEKRALATLMVQDRKTSRYLLFDDQLLLCGHRFEKENKTEWARPAPARQAPSNKDPQALAFSGIHIISPRLLPMITEDGIFSIITTYLRLAAQGERILAFRADESYWRDLGNLESVQQAAKDLRQFAIL